MNEAADQAPGFVWRLIDAMADPADMQVFGDPRVLVNMSVWRDIASLQDFTYGNALHRDMVRRRAAWFDRLEVFLGLWWVPAGYRPRVAEGKARLEVLRARGPCVEVFTFSRPFGVGGV